MVQDKIYVELALLVVGPFHLKKNGFGKRCIIFHYSSELSQWRRVLRDYSTFQPCTSISSSRQRTEKVAYKLYIYSKY